MATSPSAVILKLHGYNLKNVLAMVAHAVFTNGTNLRSRYRRDLGVLATPPSMVRFAYHRVPNAHFRKIENSPDGGRHEGSGIPPPVPNTSI